MITLTSTTSAVVLPNPILGDSSQIDIKTRFKITMTGKVFSYKKTPIGTLSLLRFNNLSRRVKSQLKKFLYELDNNPIIYTDIDGTVWQALILNDPFESENVDRNFWAITIQLELLG